MCFFSHKISPLLGAIIKVLELLLNWVVCKLVFTTEKKKSQTSHKSKFNYLKILRHWENNLKLKAFMSTFGDDNVKFWVWWNVVFLIYETLLACASRWQWSSGNALKGFLQVFVFLWKSPCSLTLTTVPSNLTHVGSGQLHVFSSLLHNNKLVTSLIKCNI